MNGYEYDYDMYVWEKYKLNSTHTLNEESTYSFNTGTFTAWKSMYLDSNGIIQLQNQYGSDYVAMNLYFENDIWKDYPYLYGHVWDSTDRTYRVDSANGTNVDNIDIKLLTVSTSYSRGSYIGEMTNHSRSAYPDNNYEDNYWYVYNRFYTKKIISEYKVVETNSTTKIMSQVSASSTIRCYSTLGVLEDGTIFGNESQSAVLRVRDLPSSAYPYTSGWYKITSKSGRTLYTVYGTPLSTSKE